jgi:hypothetical protein
MRGFTKTITLAAVAAAVALTAVVGPATAARQVNPPAWFICNRYPATISISPPRIWASGRVPERVVWLVQIERWNSSTKRYYNYTIKPQTFWSTFNYYGQGVVPWGTPKFHNSTMNLRVSHTGYYRVASAVDGSQGAKWGGYVGGNNKYCYVR